MKYFFLLPAAIFAWVFAYPGGTTEPAPTPTYRSPLGNPIELGKVKWLRNLEEAQAQSDREEKPIFLLFQEVPGCSTCRNYGGQVLSHPLVVEAIETLFVPLAIHNNKQGYDAKVLRSFGEPSWNNPVVRIIKSDKKDLAPRLSGQYHLSALVNTMILSLQIARVEIPEYLRLLEEELSAREQGLAEANLSMYCFWSGEKNLGQLEGVIETQAGFMNGKEVVQVKYDPEKIALPAIVEHGAKTGCADQVFVDDPALQKQAQQVLSASKVSGEGQFRLDREPKYYLAHSHYQYVPMTQLQAARANSLLAHRKSPEAILSPRQRELAQYIAQHPKRGWKSRINEKNLIGAWDETMALQ